MSRCTKAAAVIVAGMLAVVLTGAVAGCSSKTSRPEQKAPAMHPEASAVAKEFHRVYIKAQDFGKAWDLALPGVVDGGKANSREEFIQHTRLNKPVPVPDYHLREMRRVKDYVYLFTESSDRWLIWVTQDGGIWKVSRCEFYDGGEIPW